MISLFIRLQMEGQNWAETRDALLEIAEHALKQNVDEIDIIFFNSSLIFRGVKVRWSTFYSSITFDTPQGSGKIKEIFSQVQPSGTPPLLNTSHY